MDKKVSIEKVIAQIEKFKELALIEVLEHQRKKPDIELLDQTRVFIFGLEKAQEIIKASNE